MARLLKTKSVYYNDVNLIARPSVINSRSEVPKELNRIIVSPMDAVIGETFAKEADKLGLTICLHRFCTIEQQINIFRRLKNTDNIFVSVGLNDLARVKALSSAGAKNFLIDVANGYIPIVQAFERVIINSVEVNKLMVGNVMTADGYHNLITEKPTYVRIGIAGGSVCATSDMTGYNRGQITELMEVKHAKDNLKIENLEQFIVADGGIKNGNYAAKAFAAGADYVMMGGYFARAQEAETYITGDGTYWGGASHKQQERCGGVKRHSEGKVVKIEEEIKPLATLVDELWGGLASAISYSGYRSLTEFIGHGIFEIKQNSLPPSKR